MSNSILDRIGNTPLVELKRVVPNTGVRVFAKLEYLNPGGSIKDRTALYMINKGEESGELTPEKTVIEATSGNTGIGLALICAVKGYRLKLAMSEAASVERQKILRARGAEIVLTPGHLGTDGAIEEVYRLARENPEKYFMSDQYNNAANWQAHYEGTAVEIWEQTGGEVSTVVATMGTTGTLMGLSRRLKEYNPHIRIVGVEPYLGHKIQGLKNMKEAYQPELYDKKRLDVKVNVDDEDAFEMTRRLAREEGLFVGMSSGAAVAVAVKEAEKMGGGTMVVILPDGGERYLSTSVFTPEDKVGPNLHNTMSGKKEVFVPSVPGKVTMYSCGPTVHDRMDLSECRRFVFADFLSRYLEFRGFSVEHVVNITDLDDKTIAGSEKENMELAEFTEKYIDLFKRDLATLKVKPAFRYPRVSTHVNDMVKLAARLVEKGFAYEKLRSIYFNISRFKDYGALSGVDLNKIRLGATVDLDEYEKDNPRDFTLLKRTRLSEMKRGICVKTEWGNVRPSLHIQCAAISMKYLGESFDIHTSSRELMFPHHENEIAIAGALTGKPLARYWYHCDRVLENGKKLDGNKRRVTLGELAEKGFSGREIRFWMLSCHYRKPLGFSWERLEGAARALAKIDACLQALAGVHDGDPCPELDQVIYDIRQGFIQAMDDDMNISAVLAAIFNAVKKINILVRDKNLNREDAGQLIEVFKDIDSVLRIFNFDESVSSDEVRHIIEEREKARADGNWEISDRLREQLVGMGISVRDHKI